MHTRVESASALQPVGTTSNEAVHAQQRAAFRHVYEMHVPVKCLKLNCFVLSKQVVFEGALRESRLRQRRQDDIHARVLSRLLLKEDVHGSGGVPSSPVPLSIRRATRPLSTARTDDGKLGSLLVKKKTKAIKRTVFTRSKQAHLTWAGGSPALSKLTS